MEVDASEDIAKAICSDTWDEKEQRISPSLFKGKDTSVSRLSITSLDNCWELFRRRVQKPPSRMLELIGTINVGHLQEIGRAHEKKPTELTVVHQPLNNYESHAEIPENITRGLANKIIKKLTRHFPPEKRHSV